MRPATIILALFILLGCAALKPKPDITLELQNFEKDMLPKLLKDKEFNDIYSIPRLNLHKGWDYLSPSMLKAGVSQHLIDQLRPKTKTIVVKDESHLEYAPVFILKKELPVIIYNFHAVMDVYDGVSGALILKMKGFYDQRLLKMTGLEYIFPGRIIMLHQELESAIHIKNCLDPEETKSEIDKFLEPFDGRDVDLIRTLALTAYEAVRKELEERIKEPDKT